MKKGYQLPEGQTWHRDLVGLALSTGIISEVTGKAFKEYLAFRHFFSHAFELDPDRIVPLVEGAKEAFGNLQGDITKMST